jgi:hypothetical protein
MAENESQAQSLDSRRSGEAKQQRIALAMPAQDRWLGKTLATVTEALQVTNRIEHCEPGTVCLYSGRTKAVAQMTVGNSSTETRPTRWSAKLYAPVLCVLLSFATLLKGHAALQFDVFLGYDGVVPEASWFPVVCEV